MFRKHLFHLSLAALAISIKFLKLVLLTCILVLRAEAKSLVVTVKSYNSATITSTNPPDGLLIDYWQTYNKKSQLTAGNTLTLRIIGKVRADISAVTISVRSNKSSGAGYLSLKNDNTEIWNIPNAKFNNSAWNGNFSTSYVSLRERYRHRCKVS